MAKTKAERAAARRERQRLSEAPDDFVLASLDDGEPIEFDVQAAEDDDKDPTFEMVAYNGGPLRVAGYYYPVVVALDSLKGTARRRPILMNHDHTQPVGHTQKIENDGKRLTMRGVLSVPGESVSALVASSSKGFPWQASVGVSAADGKRDFVDEKNTVQVNGRNVKGPVYVLRGGTLRETTICPVGADDTTRTNIAATFKETDVKFAEYVEAAGLNVDELTDETRDALQATYKIKFGGQSETPKGSEDSTDVNGALAAELADIKAALAADRHDREIQARLSGHNLSDEKRAEILANSKEHNWSADKVELEAVRATRPTMGAYVQSHSTDDHDQTEVLAAGMLLAAGVDENLAVKEHGEKTVEAARKSGANNLTIKGLLTRYAKASGLYVDQIDDSSLRDIYARDRDVQASGYSTISLPGILSNVANKTLLQRYQAAEITAMQWCSTSRVSDFKSHTRYRLTAGGEMEEVGPAGEIKHGSLEEASYSNQAKTYGYMLTLTRTMIRNDDLGAFVDLAAEIAELGAHALESKACKALTGASVGSSGFFKTSRNYLTGTANALSIDALTNAVTLFRKQVDDNDNPIMFSPQMLIVPPELETMASQLFGTLPTGTTTGESSTVQFFAENPHVGKYRPIVVPYLASTKGYPDGGTVSATAWYLIANPNSAPVVDIAFLDGKQTPTVETSETDFSTLGMQFRSVFDFGVSEQDHRGGVKSKGAA